MTTNKKLLAAALTVALGTSVAHANLADSGLYVLGGMGVGILDDYKVDTDDDKLENDTTFAWRLGAGWMYNEYFGVELNYINYMESENSYSSDNLKTYVSAQSVPLFAVVRAPVNDFALFAKVGASYNIINEEAKVNGVKVLDDTDKKWEAAYAVGGEYNFHENMAFQVEYLVTGDDFSAVMGNIAYKF